MMGDVMKKMVSIIKGMEQEKEEIKIRLVYLRFHDFAK